MRESLMLARVAKRMSKSELAALLGVSRSMVNKVEQGIRRASPDLARLWSELLGIGESEMYKVFFAPSQDNMCTNIRTRVIFPPRRHGW